MLEPRGASVVLIRSDEVITKGTSGNILAGENAGLNLDGGQDNILVGVGADVATPTTCDTIAIGRGAVAPKDHSVVINVAGDKNRGFFTNAIAFGAAGDPLSYAYGEDGRQFIATTSSRRFKADELTMPEMGDVVDQLIPKFFKWRSDVPTISTPGQRDLGLVAEDLAAVWPDAVMHDDQGRVSNVKYMWINMLLLREIQRLKHCLREARIPGI